MADPTSIENLLRAEIAAFKVAPLSFIAAIICFVFILWLVLYFLFKSRLESKDEQIKTKEEQRKNLKFRVRRARYWMTKKKTTMPQEYLDCIDDELSKAGYAKVKI